MGDRRGRIRAIAAAIAILVAARLIAGMVLPLSADEAYYWLWSRHLAAGYYDHPPAIAYCIRLGTLLFGDTGLGVRVVAILLSAAATFFVWRTGEIVLENGDAGATSALLFNLTLMVAVEALAATPDAPEIAAAAAFVFALAKLEASADGRWWIGAGIAAGLGLLSKYTALFLGLGALAWLIFVPRLRVWLLSPWTYAGALVAAAIFAPNVWWNATHGWMTFAFQFGRVSAGGLTLRFLSEFLGAQLALATPFIFVLGCAGVVVAMSRPRLQLIAAIIAPSTLYFIVHSLHDRVQGNWPSFLFPAFAVAAAAAWHRDWSGRYAALLRFSRTLAVPLAATMLVLAYAQALFGIVAIGRSDPLSRLLAIGFPDVTAGIMRDANKTDAGAILTTDYETTGWLDFYLDLELPVIALGEPYRWQMAPEAPAALLARPLLYVVEQKNDRAGFVRTQFAAVTRIDEIERRRGPSLIARYEIYRVQGLRGAPAGRIP